MMLVRTTRSVRALTVPLSSGRASGGPAEWFLMMSAALTALLQQPQPSPGSVPGISDAAAIIIGTALSLLVIYAIVAAHLRKDE